MSDITKADFHEFKEDIKEILVAKFKAHEEIEALMLKPVVDKVEAHDQILRGRSGRGGLIKDVNLFGWIASGGLLAGAGKWISDLFR